MKAIKVETQNTRKESSWLEVGRLVSESDFRKSAYPQDDKRLQVRRSYDAWSNGDGRQTITTWEIQVPDGYALDIVKIYRSREGKSYEKLS